MEQWQIEEMKKCRKSFSYFCIKYVRIINPSKGLIPFKLYPYQERVIDCFNMHRYNIVSKFRQAGLTTVAAIYGLWRCLFDVDQRILVLSKTDREAVGVGKLIEQVKSHLPEWLKPQMQNDNDHDKEFMNSNSIMWFYTCEGARSKAATFMIIDEAAFIKNMGELWKGIYPVIATGGSCAVISTVNGVGNWYEETYHRAQDKKNDFNVIDLDYTEHPDYNNPEWERRTRANLGEKGWLQEILRQFLGSGDTFLPLDIIKEINANSCQPVRKMLAEWDTTLMEQSGEEDLINENYDPGALWVWEEPKDGQEYILAADCSEGIGEDANVFHIFNLSTFEQVAEFQSNKCPTFNFAQVISQVGVYYNECLVVIENDIGPGATVLDRLFHNLRYPNIYYSTTSSRRDRPGLSLGRTNRQVCCETMKAILSNRLFKINSQRLARELNTFIFDRQTRKPKAAQGNHDDLVMALACGLYVTDIMNRELPIAAKDMSRDLISETINGDSLAQIKKELEEGIAEDYIPELDYVDLLPQISSTQNFRLRPQEHLLRSFRM